MELVIIQQNVCGRDVYEGKRTIQNYEKLTNEVRDKNPDIIFLTEFYYQKMYSITQEILEGYEFIKPISLSEEDENNDDLYASCILAIKKTKVNIGERFKLENMLALRYICVDLKIKTGEVLKVLLMYVPQTYNATKYRVEQKRKMLISANEYVENNSNTLIFVGGDMNSDIDGRTTTCIEEFEQIYKKMIDTIDTDHKKEATWKGKRLDYALVSESMKNPVNTIPVETQSDHKGLWTVLNI